MVRTFAALEIAPEARKGSHQRVVLQTLALLPPQTPSARHRFVLVTAAHDALSCSIPPGEGGRLVRRAAEDGSHRRVSPPRMLAHSRRDGYAFCDHESYRVDSYGDGAGVGTGNGILERVRGSLLALVKGHV
jgi:hypothetical protein